MRTTSHPLGRLADCMLLLLLAGSALVDEFSPALLELNERDGGWVDVI